MLPKVILSWIGRFVGIAAVVTSPLVARAAEATDVPATSKQVHRATAPAGHAKTTAKKKAVKRGARHDEAQPSHEDGDAKEAKGSSHDDSADDAKPIARTVRATRHEVRRGDDTDVTDVTVQVVAEHASKKALPKPSKTPLPTIAAAATVPRQEVMATCAPPVQHDDKVQAHKAHADKAPVERAHFDRGHAVEPRRTPILRATTRAVDEPSDPEPVAREAAPIHKAKHAKPPCLHAPIEVTRGTEAESIALTKCDGSAAPLAIDEMSVMIRPGSAAKPSEPIDELAAKADKKDSDELAPGIKRIDGRLVERLQLMLDHFAKPGKTSKLFVVSGYRPTSKGSFHATGRAIDFRVDGVENTDLVAFCKTLDDTGCGFYPNSAFIHMDVRDSGTGHVAWIDASTPGEQPEYVASWPPPPKQDESDPVKILAKLDGLDALPTEETKDTENAKTEDDSKDDDADSEPGVLLKPSTDAKRKSAAR